MFKSTHVKQIFRNILGVTAAMNLSTNNIITEDKLP